MQITFLGLAPTSAMTPCWKSTSSRLPRFVATAQHQHLCQWQKSIKPMFAVCEYLPCKSHPPLPTSQPPATNATDDSDRCSFQHLLIWPVSFGTTRPDSFIVNTSSQCLYNLDIKCAASMLTQFDWAVYGFNSGYLFSTIREHVLPFNVVLACDPYVNGHSLFCAIATCPTILSSVGALLNHICGLGVTSKLTGYLTHSHRYIAAASLRKTFGTFRQIL